MANPIRDDELHALLPDYLNNVLSLDMRKAVEAYLARSPQARVDLENLQLIVAQIERLDEASEFTDAAGVTQFLQYAQSRPLRRPLPARSWWQRWSAASWLKPAFALAIMVVVGQSAFIAHLVQLDNDQAGMATRSLRIDSSTGRTRGPVLNVHVAPDAPFADVMAAIRDVDGKVIFGTVESTMLYVELSGMPVQEAKARLKQSKVVMSVIEIPVAGLPK